uniref:Uncharacterized protein n=1 Tax=Arundo donax TaxID=35708 RepID=A0A0A9EEU1_ARUDO
MKQKPGQSIPSVRPYCVSLVLPCGCELQETEKFWNASKLFASKPLSSKLSVPLKSLEQEDTPSSRSPEDSCTEISGFAL